MSKLDTSASCRSPGLLSPGFTWIYTDQPAGHTAGAKWKCKLFLARNFHQSAPCARNVLTLNSPLVTAACCLGTRVTLPSRVPPPLLTEGEELMVSRLHKSVLSCSVLCTFYSMHTVRLSGEIFAGIWMILIAIILFDWQTAFRKENRQRESITMTKVKWGFNIENMFVDTLILVLKMYCSILKLIKLFNRLFFDMIVHSLL